jgi:hypothetical protein
MPAENTTLKSTPELLAQWFGVLGAPLAWVADHSISYAITQHACSTGQFFQLKIVSVVMLAIAVLAVLVAWRNRVHASGTDSSDAASAFGRTNFMGMLGLLMSLFFTAVIIANAVPRFILTPCL